MSLKPSKRSSPASSAPAPAEPVDLLYNREIDGKHGKEPAASQFDYIIVGSGAGGGPLASRLALAGKKVLVIESGGDPAAIDLPQTAESKPIQGETTKVPGYYAAASEDAQMSWMFSVRHHADIKQQVLDAKYAPQRVQKVETLSDDLITTIQDSLGGYKYKRTKDTKYLDGDRVPLPESELTQDSYITVFSSEAKGDPVAEEVIIWGNGTWPSLSQLPVVPPVAIDPNSPPGSPQPLPAKFRDPRPGGGKQGVFYPRSSGIGGCTAHHAMITIAPNDKDWNYIADLTGDDSWRPGPMRGYFAKFERCQYISVFDNFFKKFLGLIYKIYRNLVLLFDPRAVLDNGGHGFDGWAPTNLIDPYLVYKIAGSDKSLISAIGKAAIAVLEGDWPGLVWLKHQLFKSRIVPAIDFNDVNTRRAKPEGVFLIPIGTESGKTLADDRQSAKGRRFGVREFLLDTQRKHPDRLVIQQYAHVTRVLFETPNARAGTLGDKDGKPIEKETPRAIGVECVLGKHLYEASPRQEPAPETRVRFFAKAQGGEIILSGGAFNTPQLLMLSGIGDEKELSEFGIHHLCGADGKPLGEGRFDTKKKPLPAAGVIHLPGVGKNLQDRYEVTVVSELDKDLETLETVSFEVGDTRDEQRKKWLDEQAGLYTTNGGTLAVLRRSEPARKAGEVEPDLFTFGAPAAFRGYYWNWSHELFRDSIGATENKHRLWSWVILKAYTNNRGGTVKLRSGSPFETPEVCFDVFNEEAANARKGLDAEWKALEQEFWDLEKAGRGPTDAMTARRKELEKSIAESDAILADSKRDLEALVDAVKFMRKVNARNQCQFVREIQPGDQIKDDSEDLKKWIKTQTWGHHASCTCRMGSDVWQKDVSKLKDTGAVLDSRFRVHGVTGLRVVDASVFPRIPGYFILAPIFMISEKAADTLLEDATAAIYPEAIRADEAEAITERRRKAGTSAPATASPSRLPVGTVGLALSGGGIRSATFALGVLQSLAKADRLREVDYLSTVSGGGFIGSFLGRLYTRDVVKRSADPCGRVQDILKNISSAPIWWLRTQANYIFATGDNDLRVNLAIFWRNIFTVHLVVGALLFMVFGLLAWLPQGVGLASDWLGLFRLRALIEPVLAEPVVKNIPLSAWWWLPVLVLALAIMPSKLGFWLAPKVGSYRPYPFFSLIAWLVLLTGSLIALNVPNGFLYAGGAAGILILSWIWQEVARWGALQGRDTMVARRQVGGVVRNRISRGLGEALFILFAVVGWVVLDTLAALFAAKGWAGGLSLVMAALAPFLPFLQKIAMGAKQQISLAGKEGFSLQKTANAIGIPLAIFLLGVVDVLAHHLINTFPGWNWGIGLVLITGAFCLAIGRAFDFLNLSSLHTTYAARLNRTFLGASNEARVNAPATDDGRDIQFAHPDDDIPHHEYHPEKQGGPLHLINVCVNETVDVASGREVRERKGLPMCVTPHGVSVGRRYFARWSEPDQLPRWQARRRWLDGLDGDDAQPYIPWWIRLFSRRSKKPLRISNQPAARTALQALPVGSDPNAFHVLATTKSKNAEVESLTLGAWTAVSGAAFSTGIGRGTRLPLALFMGLANVRLGYWWDSGIRSEERPARYPQPLWRRLKRLPVTIFRMQSLLLGEWRGLFHGASQWFWYLSDGGHFEVTGLYELVRRRVAFMIVSEAGEDPEYQWGDLALLTEQVREDFGANLNWLDPELKDAGNKRASKWEAFPEDERPPDWIKDRINPDGLGVLGEIRREGDYHAALGRITYDGSKEVSWVLLLKPGINKSLTEDIINYGKLHDDFPQQPTFDQVFDDEQWESYRALGGQIADRVFKRTSAQDLK